MNYLDQITVGSVTYDLQDSNAQRKILEGAGAPTTSTVGTIGQHYYNTSATQPPYEYVCVGISDSTYTWLPFGMTILKYGASGAWAQFIAAYNAHEIVYCRASSNANPASGSQTRLAFMAYVNNETTPTSVEFQYYRSVSSHNATQQGDQIYVYKLASSGTWSVEVREAYTKIDVGAGLSSTYSSGTLTLSNSQTPLPTVDSADNGKVLTVSDGAWAAAEVDALPSVTSSDNGKILTVESGVWAAASASPELPSVTSSDNGKVLGVDNGAWSVIAQSSSSGLPSVTIDDNGKVLEVVSGVWSAAEFDALPSVTSLDDGKYLGVDNGDWTIVTGVSDIYYGSSTPPSSKKVWIDPSGNPDSVAIPSGGTSGQALIKASSSNYDVTWGNIEALPSGGSVGQTLIKASASDYDIAWGIMDNYYQHHGSITLLAANWTAHDTLNDTFIQTATVSGATVTNSMKIDLQADVVTLQTLGASQTVGLYAANTAGVITIYLMGNAPISDITLSCVLTQMITSNTTIVGDILNIPPYYYFIDLNEYIFSSNFDYNLANLTIRGQWMNFLVTVTSAKALTSGTWYKVMDIPANIKALIGSTYKTFDGSAGTILCDWMLNTWENGSEINVKPKAALSQDTQLNMNVTLPITF